MPRILVIISLFLCIVFLSFYAALQGPEQEITSWEALANPQKYEGLEITGSYNRVIGGLDDYIVVGPFGHQINLKIKPEWKPKPYDFISYKGKVQGAGYIEVEEFHLHRGRIQKYLVSLLPPLVIFLWFLKKYRFNFKKFYFERRRIKQI